MDAANALAPELTSVIDAAIHDHLVPRIWQHDSTLWKDDEQAKRSIENRLGWLTAPDSFLTHVKEITEFAESVGKDGIEHVVLLGMGGSSLCVEVIRDTMGVADGHPRMLVLDSTHPQQVLATERAVTLEKTLFIVASKSGTTLESESFYTYFWSKLEPLGETRGSHFVAITDPGTVLERFGNDLHFRKVFVNPPDIGGRFSALSYFGLVPAALMGVRIDEFLSRAASEAGLCRAESRDNVGLTLGAFMAHNAAQGRDKLVLRTSDELASFGYWAEQLVAESTGKEGKGILPIEGEQRTNGAQRTYGAQRANGEPDLPKEAMTSDRVYVEMRVQGAKAAAEPENTSTSEASNSTPDVKRLELHLADVYDLGAEFFRWEFATAVAGALMHINPFDEPNVTESKAQTNKVLAQYDGRNPLTFPDVKRSTQEGIAIAAEPDVAGAEGATADVIDRLVSTARKEGSYIAIMAYLARNEEVMQALHDFRTKLATKYRLPVTVGFGPRFLHSTGQFHKGGPNTGIFIQLIDSPTEDAPVETKPYSFGTLVLAQAIGDFEALRLKGKPVVNFNLGADPLRALHSLL